MMRYMNSPENLGNHEAIPDWPQIHLSADPAIREALRAKTDEYMQRILRGTGLRQIGSILQQDFHKSRAAGLPKTDAYLKLIYATAALRDGHCETAALHDELYMNPDWQQQFLTIQIRDPLKFDELSWNAAEVIKEYAEGTRPLVLRP